jgi:hypothetical protein
MKKLLLAAAMVAALANPALAGEWWEIHFGYYGASGWTLYSKPRCQPAEMSPATQYDLNRSHGSSPRIVDEGNDAVVVELPNYPADQAPMRFIYFRGAMACEREVNAIVQQKRGTWAADKQTLERYR